MEIGTKMNAFYECAIDVATAKAKAIEGEYEKSFQTMKKEQEKEKHRQSDVAYKIKITEMQKENNRVISEQITQLKRELSIYINDKKEQLFSIVEEQLRNHMKTKTYEMELKQRILKAKEFAKTKEITIYINVTDANRKEWMEKETGIAITISQIDFMGGMRAVIPSKNILIDESYATKFGEQKEAYIF